jgi:chromosome segregation ATPase
MSNIDATQEIKSLKTQILKLEAESKTLSDEIKGKQKDFSTVTNKIKTLKTKLETIQLSSAEPIVSEHAILRYLERVRGIDLEEIKKEILDDKAKEHIKFAKSCKIKRSDHTLIVRDNTIVTVEI